MNLLKIATTILFLVPLMAMAETSGGGLLNRITVTSEGQGPDVVLIPGMASSSEVWAKLADELKNKHRIHRVQVAGFAGAAPVEDAAGPVVEPVAEAVAQYIVNQGLRTPAVIGHSLGGEVALMLAARYPSLAGRVMVVDALPFYSLLLNSQATTDSMKPQARAFSDGLLKTPRNQYETMQIAAIDRLVGTSSELPAVVASALRSDRTTVASATYDLMTLDLRPELSRIAVPVTVLYAYDVRYGMLPATVEQLFRTAYADLPAAKLVRIDDSLHFVMLDQPARFAEEVQRFLATD